MRPSSPYSIQKKKGALTKTFGKSSGQTSRRKHPRQHCERLVTDSESTPDQTRIDSDLMDSKSTPQNMR